MDLHSADDKLVTSILKYANYTTINRLRKINEKIDKIAKESSWLREKFIQEERRLYALLTSGRNADITLKIHVIHTSDEGSLDVIYRVLEHKDWKKAERLGSLAFPSVSNICWEYALQTPETRYVIGVFDLYENLLGAVCMARKVVGSKSAEELERMEKTTRKLIEGKSCSYIVFVAVHEKYRRYGLGSELLRRTINFSKISGDELIYLHTQKDNKAARRLYEQTGFSNEAVLEKFYGNSENGILYAMRLKENTELVNGNSSTEPENVIQEKPKTPEPAPEENPQTHPDQSLEMVFDQNIEDISKHFKSENKM